MRFRRFFATVLAALALAATLTATMLLTGCSGKSDSDGEQHSVSYAKIYNPDGTLLVEGEYDMAWLNYDYATVRIDGVKYRTSYKNIVMMSWVE